MATAYLGACFAPGEPFVISIPNMILSDGIWVTVVVCGELDKRFEYGDSVSGPALRALCRGWSGDNRKEVNKFGIRIHLF